MVNGQWETVVISRDWSICSVQWTGTKQDVYGASRPVAVTVAEMAMTAQVRTSTVGPSPIVRRAMCVHGYSPLICNCQYEKHDGDEILELPRASVVCVIISVILVSADPQMGQYNKCEELASGLPSSCCDTARCHPFINSFDYVTVLTNLKQILLVIIWIVHKHTVWKDDTLNMMKENMSEVGCYHYHWVTTNSAHRNRVK